MPQGISLNKDQLITAAYASKGHVATVCKMMNCRNKAVYEWIKTDPDVAEAFENARDEYDNEQSLRKLEILNMAYDSIKNLLIKNDVTATIFILKTIGELIEKKESGEPKTINVASRNPITISAERLPEKV